MKLLFSTMMCAVLSFSTFAQEGSYYLGGNVGFNSSKTKVGSTETSKTNSWTFSPEVGTFLTNNVQLGIGLSLKGSTTEAGNSEIKESQYGGTLYSRYFFGEGSKAFRPFVGANLSVLPGKSETTTTVGSTSFKSESDLMELGANLNAGFAYALSKKVTVVGSLGVLGFTNETEKPDGGTKITTNSFGFEGNSLGNRFTIGVYLTL